MQAGEIEKLAREVIAMETDSIARQEVVSLLTELAAFLKWITGSIHLVFDESAFVCLEFACKKNCFRH